MDKRTREAQARDVLSPELLRDREGCGCDEDEQNELVARAPPRNRGWLPQALKDPHRAILPTVPFGSELESIRLPHGGRSLAGISLKFLLHEASRSVRTLARLAGSGHDGG